MEKTFVIVKHLNGNGSFLFLVPKGALLYDAGVLVECDTKKGPALGITLCDTFKAEPDVICPLFNTTMENMRYVTAKFQKYEFHNPEVQHEDGQPEQRDTV